RESYPCQHLLQVCPSLRRRRLRETTPLTHPRRVRCIMGIFRAGNPMIRSRPMRLNPRGSETSSNQIRSNINRSQILIEISMDPTQITHSEPAGGRLGTGLRSGQIKENYLPPAGISRSQSRLLGMNANLHGGPGGCCCFISDFCADSPGERPPRWRVLEFS